MMENTERRRDPRYRRPKLYRESSSVGIVFLLIEQGDRVHLQQLLEQARTAEASFPGGPAAPGLPDCGKDAP